MRFSSDYQPPKTSWLKCDTDPSHRLHRGECSTYVAAETAFFADNDGIQKEPTKIGYPKSFRRRMAARLGMPVESFDRALYRTLRSGS